MISYRYLLPEQVSDAYNRVEQFLPDNRRNLQVFAQLYLAKDSAFFEVGDYYGIFWLTELIPGWKANVHIVLWDDKAKHLPGDAKRILEQIMQMFRLQVVYAAIPTIPTYAGAVRYCEKIGFHYHCILPLADQYDSQRTDMHLLTYMKET